MADEPTLDPETTARQAAVGARDVHGHRMFRWMAVLALVGVVVLALGILDQAREAGALREQVGSVSQQQASAASAADRLANQVRALGATPVVQPPPPHAEVAVPSQQSVDDAVASYLSAHPPAAGRSATPAMVAAAVASYLIANPPPPGRPPTAEEIAAAASGYLSTHAHLFQGLAGTPGTPGAAGTNGANGANATDAQVSAAVAAYCSTHGGCQGSAGPAGPAGTNGQAGATGVAGPPGPQGVSITDLTFARDSAGQCQVAIQLHDPATGTDTTVKHSAGDAACPLVTIPTG